MKTELSRRLVRKTSIAGAIFGAALTGATWAQQPADGQNNSADAAREKAKEKISAARDTQKEARQGIQDAREGGRDSNRDDRQTTRNTREEGRDKAGEAREGKRDEVRNTREEVRDTVRESRQTTRDTREAVGDTARDERQNIRDARRDIRSARREFVTSRIRSGDLGLWLRNMAGGLTVSDVSGKGAISQSGLKEGDEIVSVNGHPVTSERDFVDQLFANHDNAQPAQVVVKRNGQQQTISIQTKAFVEEHLASNNQLHDFGLILDESDAAHVKVHAVVPRSPAFYAGLKSGDQITGFNGQRINVIKDLVQSIAGTAQKTANLEVNRNNQKRQLEIDIPDENAGDESRTALRPTLPQPGAAAPQPQGANNFRAPSTANPQRPATQQPRPNNPPR